MFKLKKKIKFVFFNSTLIGIQQPVDIEDLNLKVFYLFKSAV